MRKLRTAVFWMHLSVALAAGLVVAVMAATGAMLAFEKELLSRVEGEAPAADADAALARVKAARPDTPVTSLVLRREGGLRLGLGRDQAVVVAAGEVLALPGQGWRRFLGAVNDWHRALGAQGERRALGRAITGAANAAFLFLAVSGLFLWWPRRWTGRPARLSLWFRRGLTGKARDWNRHNVIGFWSLPVLLVVTASGLVISYRWASDLVYRMAGEAPPAPAPAVVPAPSAGARPLPLEALLAVARREVPDWRSITWRAREAGHPRGNTAPTALIVREAHAWPPFASVQLSLDPFTGAVLRRESHATATTGRRARAWLRFLHTGEALGWPGQLAAGAASLGTLVLAFTGGALAWRRLRRRRDQGLRTQA